MEKGGEPHAVFDSVTNLRYTAGENAEHTSELVPSFITISIIEN